MYQSNFLRCSQQLIHSGYLLNQLVRSKSTNPEKWKTLFLRIRDKPHELKTSKGKEIALTLNGLSHAPTHSQSSAFMFVLNGTTQQAVNLVGHAMNEKSIAITALSIARLADKVSPDLVASVFHRIDEVFRDRPIKHPQNLAQIAYSLSLYKTVPVGDRASALNTWLRDACLIQAKHFHVADIVQTLVAYAKCQVSNPDVLQALEQAVSNQLQYMDHRSLSSVSQSFARLGHSPNQTLVDAIVATSVQFLGEMNSQSLCCTLAGLELWISDERTIDIHSIQEIVRRVPDLLTLVPANALGRCLRSLLALKRHFDIDMSELRHSIKDNLEHFTELLDKERERTKLLVEIITRLETFDAGIGNHLIEKLLIPKLKNSPAEIRGLILPLAIPMLSESEVIDLIDDIRDVRQLKNILLVTRGKLLVNRTLTKLQSIPYWNDDLSQSDLEEVVKHVWQYTGTVREALRMSIADGPLRDWMNSETWDLEEFKIFIVGTSESAPVESQTLLPPPPGFDLGVTKDEAKEYELRREISAVDPLINLDGLEIHYIENMDPSPGELAVATCTGPKSLLRILVPRKFCIDTALGIQVLHLVFQ
jgi:hypothetical protein